jgi:BASS family bile acid:Na+ symporter
MLKSMLKFVLSQSYLVTMAVAVLCGMFIPHAHDLTAWNTFFLQAIFFMSCLKLDMRSYVAYIKDWKFLVLANALMLVIFPTLVWLVWRVWPSDLLFAIYLLAAMPIGMTAALLVDLNGGKSSITMILTATTSLLSPFTITFLTKFLFGASVHVNATQIFTQLASVIFIPFILALIVRRIWPKAVDKVKDRTKPLSIFFLGLTITGAVGSQVGAAQTIAANWLHLIFVILVLYAFFLITNYIGYFSFWWEPHANKQTVSISLACMNFTLAIYLASQFFPRPSIVLPLVLSIIPWVTFMPIWLRISKNFK